MKKLHKTAAVALAVGMMFSSVPMVASANTVTVATGDLTQERAIEVAKSFVSLPKGYDFRQASYSENGYTRGSQNAIWQIGFGNENPRMSGWVNVLIDAKTGELLSMDAGTSDTTSFDQTISRDAARAKALDYMKKVAGDKLNSVQEIKPEPNLKGDPYNRVEEFRFVRMVNGIPYLANGLNVRVSADGSIVSYSRMWNEELNFPKATPAVTEAQALEALRKSLNLDLQYTRTRKPFATEDTYQLVYTMPNLDGYAQLPQIDANQGVAIGMDGKPVAEAVKNEWKPLADKATAPTNKEVTKEQALDIIKSFKIIPADVTVANTNFESTGESKVWRFDLQKGQPKEKDFKQMSVTIDANTGEIESFYNFGDPAAEFPETPAVTEEQARQKAIDFVKSTMGSRLDKMALAPKSANAMPEMGAAYSFAFVNLIDGIPVSNQITRVSINPNTGDVSNVYTDRSPFPVKDYAKKADAMTAETAVTKFLDKYKLQLQYVPVYESESKRWDSPPTRVALVYAPFISSQVLNLDAVTGQWTMPWGGEPAEKAPITDIKGHWAEKQLQFMADRGIFEVADGKVSPDTQVTRGDMVRYLILALNGPRMKAESSSYADVGKDSGNFDFIEEAVARQWLDKSEQNFRPDDAITRAELSEFIATALGYKKLSETDNIFKNNFSDVSEQDKRYFGDIAVVSALGILTAPGGKFGPNQTVTRAQASIVLTRVLDQYRNSIINYRYY